MERSFFHQVQDAFDGSVIDVRGARHSAAHPLGVEVWFDDSTREHYEAQLIRIDGTTVLEVGFHAEHPKVDPDDVDAAIEIAARLADYVSALELRRRV